MEDMRARVAELRERLNAVILVHNYCTAEVQEVADFVGDSLGLAIKASETDADVIVFCGVTFMAETAKILNPDKTVLIPEPQAICSMAQMCDPEQLARVKERHPDAVVVGYVNSTADTKRLLDVCCTSSNAVDVVSGLEGREVLFVPDRNLGTYVASKCPDKYIVLWNGFCPMHNSVTVRNVLDLKERYPDAPVIAHPECRTEVLELADVIGSTEKMIGISRDTPSEDVIVLTEVGMKARLEREVPGKRFHFIDTIVCPSMKMIDLRSVVDCMENMSVEVELDDDTLREAYVPVKRMIG
ncbi:MAG: quinolinate synthase NadA [Candidatus Methanomethylophilaceae archaeon]|nr:quinolinate synthase NadA [Candidatus Methanomethylophilaceae archaeon]